MIELPIYNRAGQQVGTVELDEADFGGKVRQQLIRDAIVMYEAAQRVGTACTKTRGEVVATRAKPWRQKGTGRARAGFRRSPIWRGGGVVFGPKPRDYRYSMPRKAVRAATLSALLAKFADATTVIDELSLAEPRTREVASTLAALGIDRGCLIAIEGHDTVLWKSGRNIPRVSVKPVAEINAYDLLRHPRLLITKAALDALVATTRKRATTPATAAQADAEPAAAGTNE